MTEVLKAGIEPLALLVSETALERAEVRKLIGRREPVVLKDSVLRAISDTETPQGIAAEIAIPRIERHGDCVFLEGVQDPSNVGAIVRTAAAFGMGAVVLDRGCADAWAPKTLRAGMGGHFNLGIRQVVDLEEELAAFEGKLVSTVLEGGTPLPQARLDGRLGWIFGSEGGGISDAVRRRAAMSVRILMAAGTQSINVAAAAAICLYEAFRRTENQPPARKLATPLSGGQ